MVELSQFRKVSAKLATEFIGTLALAFTIQVAGYFNNGKTAPPLAIGIVYAVFVYIGGKVSGGHYNPAITLAVFLRGKISAPDGLYYWLAQFLGGIAGALIGRVTAGGHMVPTIGKHHNFLQAMLAELIFTSFLVLVVLATTTQSATENNGYYGAAIGLTLTAGIIAIGEISGGVLNPAVGLGLVTSGNWFKMPYFLWITLAQVGGALLGAIYFFFIAPEDFQNFDLTESAREARDALTNK